MAKPILTYDNGQRTTLVGTADGQLPTWDNTLGEWQPAAPAQVTAANIVGGGAGTAGYYLRTTDGTTVEWAVGGGGGSGTVTSVSAGTGIAITGDNTVNPTVALAALSPDPSGTVGGAATVAQVTVDAYGRVTAASGVAIAISASAVTSGQLALARGGTGIDASTVTAGQLLIGATSGGMLALQSVSGDATLAHTGALTVTGLQTRPVSSAAPDVGEVIAWNGTEYVSVPMPSGGSGGGGVIYFFNQGTAGSGTGLPASTFQMGRTAQAAYSQITKSSISTGGWDRVGGFVTDAGDPNISTLPTGVWDLNLWATTASALGNVRARFVLYAYDNATDPELGVAIATSSEVEMFDQGTASQYIASLVVPSNVDLSGNKRLYLKLETRASVPSQSVEFGFGDAAPSHTHTTVPSVTGTGVVKVLNSVIVATGQQVSLTSEVSGTLPIGNGGTGAATANANTVFAGPTTGAAAAPGFRALVAADLPPQPYDLSGEYPGTVQANGTMFRFIAARAFTIKNSSGTTASKAYCETAPSSEVILSVRDNGVEFATITFPASTNVGTVALTGAPADYNVVVDDRITVVAPASVHGIKDVTFTFFAVTP